MNLFACLCTCLFISLCVYVYISLSLFLSEYVYLGRLVEGAGFLEVEVPDTRFGDLISDLLEEQQSLLTTEKPFLLPLWDIFIQNAQERKCLQKENVLPYLLVLLKVDWI